MFQKFVVAYNESPESTRALASALQLAKALGAQVHTITVMADLPAYTAYAVAGGATSPGLRSDQRTFYENLQERARLSAAAHGVELQSHLIEGHEVTAIVEFLRHQKADLLVLGLHQRDLYVARLWSTVYELAQEAPCSVLGVH